MLKITTVSRGKWSKRKIIQSAYVTLSDDNGNNANQFAIEAEKGLINITFPDNTWSGDFDKLKALLYPQDKAIKPFAEEPYEVQDKHGYVSYFFDVQLAHKFYDNNDGSKFIKYNNKPVAPDDIVNRR